MARCSAVFSCQVFMRQYTNFKLFSFSHFLHGIYFLTLNCPFRLYQFGSRTYDRDSVSPTNTIYSIIRRVLSTTKLYHWLKTVVSKYELSKLTVIACTMDASILIWRLHNKEISYSLLPSSSAITELLVCLFVIFHRAVKNQNDYQTARVVF